MVRYGDKFGETGVEHQIYEFRVFEAAEELLEAQNEVLVEDEDDLTESDEE